METQEKIDAKDKEWIDAASYETLLDYWRNAPVGAPMFRGATGDYYSAVMRKKRDEVGPGGAVAASKNVGW